MKLYNTLTKNKDEFVPLIQGEVSMYTCGPTVYHYAHIGNLRTYIHEDILEKTLNAIGNKVNRVMNITDVGHLDSDGDEGEDKMIAGARRENKTVWEVAQYYTDAFFADCEKLNIKRPEIVAKATDHIQDYIEFIQGLEAKGYTYFANGNVYFDISKFERYTELSRMNLDELRVALREDVEEDAFKKNPQDFVLWFTKSKFDNQAMKWESPWGIGYPGWHIECSVISLKHLGPRIDIHCGGVDHIPVHHTNEIAQTESYTGEKWVNYWWHGEFLIDKNGKMSKSQGEFLTVSLLEEKSFLPLAYRYFVLGAHYRKPLAFTFDSLEMAQKAYLKLVSRVRVIVKDAGEWSGQLLSPAGESHLANFLGYLSDDLNTANALMVLYDVLKDGGLSNGEKCVLISKMDEVLSLDLMVVDAEVSSNADEDSDSERIENMIVERTQAKANRDFAKADQIRNQLLEEGIVLVDSKEGTTWNKQK